MAQPCPQKQLLDVARKIEVLYIIVSGHSVLSQQRRLVGNLYLTMCIYLDLTQNMLRLCNLRLESESMEFKGKNRCVNLADELFRISAYTYLSCNFGPLELKSSENMINLTWGTGPQRIPWQWIWVCDGVITNYLWFNRTEISNLSRLYERSNGDRQIQIETLYLFIS